MNVSLSDMNSLSFDVLKKMQDVNADLEIARRVVKNDSLAVNFFLEEFSIKILDYIGKTLCAVRQSWLKVYTVIRLQ